MKFKNILLMILGIFLLAGVFIYAEPSITGYAVQERFMISDVKVSAQNFEQEVRVEQFDEHEIKFDNGLYYFVAEPEYEQDINYVLIEFMADSSQIRGFGRENIGLYFYEDGWLELDVEFVRQDGRFLYYRGRSERFGLFAVGLREKEEAVKPLVSRNELILFALLPLLCSVLLFSIFFFGFVEIVQRINYRVYLFFRKVLFGVLKFVLSFGVVVAVLDLMSPRYGDASSVNLIYYAVIPLVLFSLFTDIILNFILYVRRLIYYNWVYRFSRNWFWFFIFSLAGIFGLLVRFVPKIEGSVSRGEIVIFGLLPAVFAASLFALVFSLFCFLVKRLVYHE